MNNETDTDIPSSDLDSILPEEMEGLQDNQLLTVKNGLNSIISGDSVYYERLPMLEVVFDRLVRLMTTSMRNFTSDNVEINLESIASVRFGDYLTVISEPAMINVFVAEEWDNNGLVIIDSDLIYTVIDVLLGGRRGNAPIRPDNRYYTTIEMNLIEKMTTLILMDLSAAFDPLCPVNFRFERLETNPKFATIARPANAAVLVRLNLKVDNRGGGVEIILPYGTLEPIRDLLLQNFMGEKFGRDTIWESHLAGQLYFTDLEISAILDQVHLPLEDVLNWQPGSQILLNATPTSPINLVCGDHQLFVGHVGRKSGNIAVKIDNFCRFERV